MLTKSAKASVAMMCISIVLVFLLCFGFSWRRRDGELEPDVQIKSVVQFQIFLACNPLKLRIKSTCECDPSSQSLSPYYSKAFCRPKN